MYQKFSMAAIKLQNMINSATCGINLCPTASFLESLNPEYMTSLLCITTELIQSFKFTLTSETE